jgi:hypothetical protein
MYKHLLMMIGHIKNDSLRANYGDTLAKIASMKKKADRDVGLRGLKLDLRGDISNGR